MATLVLTALGSAVGGPIGAAIGAVIGSTIDRATILRPGRREGPRLTELALQTSSYGTQIPKVFGTMRVGGTVIWATDLMETRSRRGGGKSQPAVDSFTYAASFAVLLSAREVGAVRRIWADGSLLRGAAGDMKVAGTARLHNGGEDQPVDPLIASAEGPTMTPAWRGCAYAVFEQLALADYGNRIPQMTFEVVADPDAVGIGAIGAALADEVDPEPPMLMLDGFAASGGSVRAVLETLATAGGAWFAPVPGGLAMRAATDEGSAVSIADQGIGTGTRGQRAARTIAAADTVPVSIAVGHHDPARDYQAGLQRARRPGPGGRDERIDVPAVISAATAKTIAEAALARAEAGRVRRVVTLGFAGLALSPGACVTISGEQGLWRITRVVTEGMATRVELNAVVPAGLTAIASSGRVAAAVDVPVGPTILHAFETPVLGDIVASVPVLTIAAAGASAGWRRASLMWSADDGASWTEAGASAAAATIGTLESVAPSRGSALEDRAGAIVVMLADADAVLGDADAGAIDRGQNLALIGDELVQFAHAMPLGAGRWRLTGLLRGRRGTEGAVAVAGDRFVLMEADTARTIELPVAALGREIQVSASGVGDDAPAVVRLILGGASLRPPTPVHLTTDYAADGSAAVRWIRRSRAGWRWIDGVDAPLVEEAERYHVTVTTGDGRVRVGETTEARWLVSIAERSAGPVRIAVAQRGTITESLPAEITI